MMAGKQGWLCARVFIALVIALLPAVSWPQTADNPLLGMWRLTGYSREYVATGEHADVFGAKPAGYIVYQPNGRMMVLAVADKSIRPSGPNDDAARLKLYNTLLGYAGTYTIQGQTVTHHIEVSENQANTGSDFVRRWSLDGKVLKLRTTPRRYAGPGGVPGDNREIVNVLTWEKVD
jgi:lipocalin-like protein